MIYNSFNNIRWKEEIMVINYLEKIREKYQNELIELNLSLRKTLSVQRENIEIIKLLELNEDPNFEAFTPRPVNSFNKKKLVELNEEQKIIEQRIEDFKEKISDVEKEIEEVTEVIRVAKECIL
jgi:two-component system sensor histidine kinase DegS